MGAHVDRGPHDASSRRHASCHGPASRRPTLACIHATCISVSMFALIRHVKRLNPSPRLILSSRHIHVPQRLPCEKHSRPCQRGQITSKKTHLSKRVWTLFLAQLDWMPGPVGVCIIFYSIISCVTFSSSAQTTTFSTR